MTGTTLRRRTTPTASQRAFVAAAGAVGLPPQVICEMMPREKGDRVASDPARLDADFAQERSAGPTYALRLIIARVLQRALLGTDEHAVAAQMAVFKSVAEWPKLAQDERAAIPIERLEPEERATLRALVAKAMDEGEG